MAQSESAAVPRPFRDRGVIIKAVAHRLSAPAQDEDVHFHRKARNGRRKLEEGRGKGGEKLFCHISPVSLLPYYDLMERGWAR